MSPTPHDPQQPHDPLLQRYEEANALDEARPGEALRQAVLAHAQLQTETQAPAHPATAKQPAANDSQWAWRTLGSLAVFGLVGLLVMQFERGTPAEQEMALDAPDPRANTDSSPQAETSAATPLGESTHRRATGNATKAAPSQSTAPPPLIADAKVEGPEPSAAPAPSMAAAKAPSAKKPRSAPPMADIEQAAPTEQVVQTEAQTVAPASKALNESRQPARRESAAGDQVADQTVKRSNAARGSANASLPALHTAAFKGELSAVLDLLAKGANIDARDHLGRTALMLAAIGHRQSVLTALINAGADTTLVDQAHLSAEDHARQAGHADWLPLLQPPR